MNGAWFGRVLVPGKGELNWRVPFLKQENIPGEISWQSGGGESPPSTRLLHSFWYSPGLSGLWVLTVGSSWAFNPWDLWVLLSVGTPVCAPDWLQNLVFGLAELHEILVGSLLKYIPVPLDGITFLSHVNCTAQLHLICRLDRDVQSRKK